MIYIIVVDKNGKIELVHKHSEKEVLSWVATIGFDEGDPRVVKRVFSVDADASIRHYRIEFNRKLMLTEVPDQLVRGSL